MKLKDIIQGIIAKFPDRSVIDLSSNGIHDISGLELISEELIQLSLSKNNLSNLQPLASAVHLQILNLSYNKISSLDALSTLKELTSLDVSSNEISTLAQLSSLSSLSSLESLSIISNPICKTPAYPLEILALCPQLKYLDNRPVSHIKDEYSLQKSCLPEALSPQATAELVSLHTQLASLHEVFEIQELALENNASSCAGLSHNYMQQKFSSQIEGQKLHTHALETEKILSNFPYVRLLQSWRKQTLAKTIQNTFLHNELEKSKHVLREEQNRYKETLNSLDADRIRWRQKAQSLTESTHLLQQKLDQLALQQQLGLKEDKPSLASSLPPPLPPVSAPLPAASSLKEEQVTLLLQKSQQDFTRVLAASLQKLQQKYSQYALVSNSKLVFCLEKLEKYEKQILSLSEQVDLLSLLLQQREVHERNSFATLEATKRLYETKFLTQLAIELSIIIRKHNALSSGTSGIPATLGKISPSLAEYGGMLDSRLDYALIESLVDESFPTKNLSALEGSDQTRRVDKLVSSLLSQSEIPPEAEALLKSVFLTIDIGSAGVVAVSNLLRSFVKFEDCEIQDLSSKTLEDSITPLGTLLFKALNSTQISNFFGFLLSLYQRDTQSTITWGELLLSLLSPVQYSTTEETSPLQCFSPEEIHRLSQHSLCESIDWGVIPLQLDTKSIDSLVSSSASSSNSAASSKEVQRLRFERKALMKRLRDQTRHSTHLCESIKQFYEAELRLLRTKLAHAEESKKNLKDKNSTLEAKIIEMSEQNNASLAHSRDEITALTQRLAEAQQKLDNNRKYFQLLNFRLKKNRQAGDEEPLEEESPLSASSSLSEDSSKISELDDFSYSELRKIIDQELEISHAKFVKLETDFLLLQRETTKKEVKCSALNRECQKLLSKQSLQQAELSRKDEEIAEKDQKISNLERNLETNEKKFTEKISNLEKEIENLKASLEKATATATATPPAPASPAAVPTSPSAASTSAASAASSEPASGDLPQDNLFSAFLDKSLEEGLASIYPLSGSTPLVAPGSQMPIPPSAYSSYLYPTFGALPQPHPQTQANTQAQFQSQAQNQPHAHAQAHAQAHAHAQSQSQAHYYQGQPSTGRPLSQGPPPLLSSQYYQPGVYQPQGQTSHVPLSGSVPYRPASTTVSGPSASGPSSSAASTNTLLAQNRMNNHMRLESILKTCEEALLGGSKY